MPTGQVPPWPGDTGHPPSLGGAPGAGTGMGALAHPPAAPLPKGGQVGLPLSLPRGVTP